MSNEPAIAIAGGGIAGLAASAALREAGFDAELLRGQAGVLRFWTAFRPHGAVSMQQALASPTQGTGARPRFAMIFDGLEQAVSPDSPDAIRVSGRVLDGNGKPTVFPDTFVELFADDQFACARADENGDWHAFIRKPAPRSSSDGRTQAPHLSVVAYVHPLLEKFQTRMYFPDETQANDDDPVLMMLGVDGAATLVADADGDGLRFDIRLSGEGETVFFAFT